MTPKQHQMDPFAEGADARLAGLPETANPYDMEDHTAEEAADWFDGWNSMDDEMSEEEARQ